MERKETVARWLKTNPEYVDSFSDFKGTVDEYFDKWNKDWQFHWHENKDKEPYPFIKKWIGSDREEKWLKLQQSNEPSLQDTIKYYQNNEIEYRLNVHGLRDEPWENKPEEVDVYLGDSNTLGTGLIRDDAYPYLISKQLDFPSLYCGAGAADITTQFNLFIFISKKFKIRNLFHNSVKKFVSMGWEDRFGNTTGIAEWDRNLQPERFEKFKDIFNPTNTSFLYYMAYHAFIGLCREKDINYIYCDWEMSNGEIEDRFKNNNFKEEFKLEDSKLNVLARDTYHASVYRHRVLANKFLEKLGYKLFV